MSPRSWGVAPGWFVAAPSGQESATHGPSSVVLSEESREFQTHSGSAGFAFTETVKSSIHNHKLKIQNSKFKDQNFKWM